MRWGILESTLRARVYTKDKKIDFICIYYSNYLKMSTAPSYEQTIITGRQYVIVRDVSGSTGFNKDCPGDRSRSEYMIEILYETADEATNVDENARIDYCTFSSPDKWTYDSDISMDTFSQKLMDSKIGGTTHGTALFREIFQRYIAYRNMCIAENKPNHGWTVIAFVDGDFNDREALAAEIASFTGSLSDAKEFKIGFIQVGNDAGAANFLKFLDDNLVTQFQAKFDIVDTKPVQWLMEHGPRKLLSELIVEEYP